MTDASCILCGSVDIAPIGQFVFGHWEVDADPPVRQNLQADYGECRDCGHVFVTTPYDTETYETLYRLKDPVFWDEDHPDGPYADMAGFCASELARMNGTVADAGLEPVVDFGCGHGRLLDVLVEQHGIDPSQAFGVDFRPLLPTRYRSLQANLDSPDITHVLPDRIAAAFATHLLEHLRDPRQLLRALRRRIAPEGFLYVEVPDNGLSAAPEWLVQTNSVVNAQHLHYFTPSSLDRLARATGWRVVRTESVWMGFMPRLKALLAPTARDNPGQTVRGFLTALDHLRPQVAGRILELAAKAPVGVWGIGIDVATMVDNSPALAQAIASGQAVLFDRDLAQRRLWKTTIRPSDTLATFSGPVVLGPAPIDVRASMRKAAEHGGWNAARLIDPYRDLLTTPRVRTTGHSVGADR